MLIVLIKMHIYELDTGFPLTKADQLTYNKWFAQEGHNRNLSMGLKNAIYLVRLLSLFLSALAISISPSFSAPPQFLSLAS